MATKLAPVQRVASRATASPASWELGVRYAAAYACVLVAVAAAQLLIPTGFAMMLAGVVLMGLPVSLGIRQHGFRIGKRTYSYAAWARIITVVTTIVVVVFLRFAMPELFSGSRYQLFVRMDNVKSLVVLMQVFLLFAVCRSFAIVTDKEAVLSTVPSFSVLLLLIVAHRGVEVVSYFLVWAVLTAVLFALDHRGETRLAASSAVPSVVPGQDVALSARALLTVVAFSFVGAIVISNFLVARQGNQRGGAENWVMTLSQRLTSSAFNFAESSSNGGPERTIDFTSGPALPTRAPLWLISANTVGGKKERYLFPQYLRMFALDRYDGRTWSQAPGSGRAVVEGTLAQPDWPLLVQNWGLRRASLRPMRFAQLQKRAVNNPAYSVARANPAVLSSYGEPRQLVRQTVSALDLTSGYLPLLPAARAIKMNTVRSSGLRVRSDGSVEIGVMQRMERAEVLSEVPDLPEYGGSKAPPTVMGERPNPKARLGAAERRSSLRVPGTLPPRVKEWAAKALRGAGGNENAYRRAQRLAAAVRNSGTYTLRPPNMPEDREATDYFLFESHRGYCTHFANALTMACRTQGIPARMVSGFVNPDWQKPDVNDRIWGLVLEANAHAWTEVWVDGWGWAVLDATPSDDRGDNAPGFWDALGDSFTVSWINFKAWAAVYQTPLLWSSAAFVAMILCARRGALAWLVALRRDWMLRREARGAFRENDLARARIIEAYRQGEKVLATRYRRRAPWETPREWIDGAQATLSLADASPLETLAVLYTRARYSVRALEEADGDAAQVALRNLSWRKGVE